MTTLRIGAAIIAAAVISSVAHAQSAPQIKFGGFVDGYYAYDFGKPVSLDRAFTTQAARHNEFNINLAFVDVSLTGDRVRGRLALQAGTSVQSNYAGEPAVGAYSGPSLARHIQEAVVGVKIGDNAWVDGGVFLSHIGAESWASRDNLSYTRSLTAEFSPYYQSGVKLTWQATPSVSVLATVVNGWQIISENNGDKSAGVRLDWTASKSLTLGYYNLVGNEQLDTTESRVRVFNGVTGKWNDGRTTVVVNADVGRQAGANGADASTWWGGGVVARTSLSDKYALVGRVERYDDKHQVIIVTGGDAFRATGISVGLDVTPQAGLMWRTEFRMFTGEHAVFPDRGAANGVSKTNALLVTALTLTF